MTAPGPVSAVIPVRNGARFIAEALRSIQAQTVVPRQIIVVDDGSTDDTPDVVKSFAGIDYVRQPPLGVSAARNTGAARAGEPHLCFLDADDLWHPAKTERQLACFTRDSGIDLVTGLMSNFRRTDEGEVIRLTEPAVMNNPGVIMIRREAFERAGPFSTELAYGENLEWWARVMDRGLKVHALGELVHLRRIHSDNTSRDKDQPAARYLDALRAITTRRRRERE